MYLFILGVFFGVEVFHSFTFMIYDRTLCQVGGAYSFYKLLSRQNTEINIFLLSFIITVYETILRDVICTIYQKRYLKNV